MRFLIVIIVILLGLYLLYRYLKRGWNQVSFKVFFKSADISGITLTDLTQIALGGAKNINAVIAADIQNDNSYPIPFSGLKIKLFYQGSMIAETSQELADKKFVVPANGTLRVEDIATIILNKAGIKLLAEKITGNGPKIDYQVSVRVFGILLPVFNGNFNF